MKFDYNDTIKFNEIINYFLTTTIYDIKNEIEIPNINFVFKKDGYILFNKFIGENNNIKNEDLLFLINHSNDSCLSVKINDSISFFKYLTDITNESIKLFKEYDENIIPKEIAIYLLRRIWLRMGISDINNIDLFLKKQLEFVKNRNLDMISTVKISSFYNYDVFMKTKINDLWDESTRSMIFTIKNNDDEYELPHVLYDIDEENICYIYAVQSSKKDKDKKVERKLYTLNKGIKEPNVHPSKIYSLLLFVTELKKKGISKVIVPSLQVLSYDYHKLLSKESKKNLDEILLEYEQNPYDLYIKNRVEYFRSWYNHLYKNEDKISYLKIDELINLFYRLLEHDNLVEIINEVGLQGDSLILKIKK